MVFCPEYGAQPVCCKRDGVNQLSVSRLPRKVVFHDTAIDCGWGQSTRTNL